MGIDALDIGLRIERAFNIKIPGFRLYTDSGEHEGPNHDPLTVGDIHRRLCILLAEMGRPVPPESWEIVTRCIGEALQFPSNQIRPEDRIKHDLRADFG